MTEYEQLLSVFKSNSDKKYDDFNKKIVNSGVKTIGCTTPFIRKTAKNYTIDQVLSFPTHDYYEVDLLKGVVISTAKLPFDEKMPLLTQFAQTIENWAVCDCSCVKPPISERERYFQFFCDLATSKNTFVCRYGLVNILGNFLDDEHIDAVFGLFRQISIWGEYYVDMAVAWLVATAMVKCRDDTVRFMENDGREVLNVFSYNKALQKMRESYRVSQEDKLWTYTMKMAKQI